MKKKILSTVAAMTLVAGVIGGAGVVKATEMQKAGQKEIGYDTTTSGAANTGNYGVTATDKVGSAQIDVKAKTEDAKVTNVYGVTYSTTELKFNLSQQDVIWNPNDLKYEYNGAGTQTWTPVNNKITVYNYSDLPIKVTGTAFSNVTGVTIGVPKLTDGFTLATASSTASPNDFTKTGTVQSNDETVVTVDGKPSDLKDISTSEYQTIGTVTINVNKAE